MIIPITAKFLNLFMGLLFGLYFPIAVLYLIMSLRKHKGIFSAIWILLSKTAIIALMYIFVIFIFVGVNVGFEAIFPKQKLIDLGGYWIIYGMTGGFFLGLMGLLIGIIKGKHQKARANGAGI
jgi:hypothetical protein